MQKQRANLRVSRGRKTRWESGKTIGDEQSDRRGWSRVWAWWAESLQDNRSSWRPTCQSVCQPHPLLAALQRSASPRHTMALLYVCVYPCVCLPTEPLTGSMDQLGSWSPPPHPHPLHVWVTLEPWWLTNPLKTAWQHKKICLLGDKGRGGEVNENFFFQKSSPSSWRLVTEHQKASSFWKMKGSTINTIFWCGDEEDEEGKWLLVRVQIRQSS